MNQVGRVVVVVGVIAGVFACGGKAPPPKPPIAKQPPAAPEPVATGTGGAMYGGGMYGGDAYGGDEYGAVQGGDPGAAPAPALGGRWISGCDKGAVKGQFVRLTYEVKRDTWSLASEVFTDAKCTKRRTVLAMTGAYEIGAPSAVAPRAWETSSTITTRTLVADDKATAKKLGRACGVKLAPGVAVDIHAKGCAALDARPAAELCTELDIAAIDDTTGELRTGARTGTDLCTAEHRPTTLGTVAFVPHWSQVGVDACDQMGVEYERIAACPKFPHEAIGSLLTGMREINSSCADIPAATAAAVCSSVLPQITEAAAKIGC